MDMKELGVVIASGTFVGFVFLIFLRDSFLDYFINIVIDIGEFIVIRIDSEIPLIGYSTLGDQDSSDIPFYFGLIRFLVGFSSVFGLYVCIKTFFGRWF